MSGSGVVYVNGKDFPELAKRVLLAGKQTGRLLDKTVATVAATGRKAVTSLEQNRFHNFNNNWTRYTANGEHKESTRYDAKMGGYKAGDGRRMMGFNFENKAFKKGSYQKQSRMLSKAYMYSLLANLYEESVTYGKRSAMFGDGNGNKRFYQAGTTRAGMHYFKGAGASAVNAVAPQAVARVSAEWDSVMKGI